MDLETKPPSEGLNVENSQVTTSNEATAQGASETKPQASVSQARSTGEASTAGSSQKIGEELTEIAGTYTPNFKYKSAYQEKEVDEMFRPLIKDKDSEEKIKRILQKADGIETVEKSRDEFKNRHVQTEKEYRDYKSNVDQILTVAKRGMPGDYGAVLESAGVDLRDPVKVLRGLGYDKNTIIQAAYHFANLTPEQIHAQNRQQELEYQASLESQHRQAYEDQVQQLRQQVVNTELQSVLSSPDVAPIAKAFDQTYGQDSFENEVRKRGAYYYHQTGQIVSSKQVVGEILQFAKNLAPQQQQIQQQPPQALAQNQKQSLPIIPSVNGASGASPARRKFKSISEVAKHYSSLPDAE